MSLVLPHVICLAHVTCLTHTTHATHTTLPPRQPQPSSGERSFKLSSGSGAVYFSLGGVPARNASLWSLTEGGTSDELRLLRGDAQALMEEVRDVHGGGPGSGKEVLVVIDVAPAPGVPSARFVYTNQPVYLTLELALLNTMTLGLYNIDRLHYRAHFVSRGCSDASLPLSSVYFGQSAVYEDEAERLRQVAAQLYAVLVPKGRPSMYGQLVYVNSSHTFISPNLLTVTRDPTTLKVELKVTRRQPAAVLAWNLSVAIGILGTALFVYLAERVATVKVLLSQQQDELLRRVRRRAITRGGTRRQNLEGGGVGVGGGDGEADEEAVHDAVEEEAVEEELTSDGDGMDWKRMGSSAFSQPIAFIDTTLIVPLRREMTDSIDAFIEQRCVWSPPEGDSTGLNHFKVLMHGVSSLQDRILPRWLRGHAAKQFSERDAKAGKKHRVFPSSSGEEGGGGGGGGEAPYQMPMGTFLRRYQRFCSIRRLQTESDMQALRHRLITKYHVRPDAQRTQRVFGVRWVSGDDEMEATTIRSGDLEPPVAADPPLVSHSEPLPSNVSSNVSSNVLSGGLYSPHFDFSRRAEEAVDEAKLSVKELAEMQLTELLVFFIESCKFVRRAPSPAHNISFVDGPKGSNSIGLETVFLDFCHTVGRNDIEPMLIKVSGAPKWGSHLLDGGFDALRLQRKPVVIEILHGVKSLDLAAGDFASLGFWFYGLNFTIVLVHIISLCLLPVGMILLLVKMQLEFSCTTDPNAFRFDARSFDSPQDVIHAAFVSSPTSGPLLLELKISISVFLAIIFVCLFNLLLAYTSAHTPLINKPLPAWLITLRQVGFFVTLSVSLFLLGAYFFVAAVWCLLAAVLNPSVFLPWASGLLTILVSVSIQYHYLVRSAKALRHTIHEEYAQQLLVSVRKIAEANRELVKLEARVKRAKLKPSVPTASGAGRGSGGGGEGSLVELVRQERKNGAGSAEALRAAGSMAGKSTDGAAELEFDPAAFFDILDVNGNGYLSEHEFFAMFERLHVNVSVQRRSEMFAYADSDEVDGRIRRDEFLEAWKWLQESMVSEISGSLGISPFQIGIALLLLFLLVSLTVAFFLFAIVAFNTNGNFTAVVQSAVISMSGASSRLLKRPKVQELQSVSPEELKRFVKLGIQGDTSKVSSV